MPIYLFQNPKTQEVIEVIQKMKDDHVYVDENGLEWKRIFTIPAAGIDGRIDSFSPQDFVEKTRGKGMTVGDMWDAAKEHSENREKILGKDPLKEKYYKNYSEKRQGMKHGNQRREEG